MSWLDPVFAILVGTLTAFGAARRLTGLWVGVGGALLLRPLLGVTVGNPVLGLVAALLAGFALGLLGRNLLAGLRTGAWWQRTMGAFGGAVLGVALVLALVTSLPIQRSPFDPNQLWYPPRDLPEIVQDAALRSWTVGVGRDVLLYPLLEAQGEVPEGQAVLLRGLHRWLVVGEPWHSEGGAGS